MPGPIFANIVLADESTARRPRRNRPARIDAGAQASIAATDYPMKSRSSSSPRKTRSNRKAPIRSPSAARPLPLMIKVDYPTDAEEELIMRQARPTTSTTVTKVRTAKDILRLQQIVRRVPVADHVFNFAKRITRLSRPAPRKRPTSSTNG